MFDPCSPSVVTVGAQRGVDPCSPLVVTVGAQRGVRPVQPVGCHCWSAARCLPVLLTSIDFSDSETHLVTSIDSSDGETHLVTSTDFSDSETHLVTSIDFSDSDTHLTSTYFPKLFFAFFETPSKSDRLPMKKNSNVFVFCAQLILAQGFFLSHATYQTLTD